MNQVKTYIDRSNIEGIGLFAAEFIPKGTLIWKLSGLDRILNTKEVEKMKLNNIEDSYFRRYEFSKEKNQYIFCSDDAKFCNHSYNTNTYGYLEQYALYDIKIGEEITCDYSLINDDFDESEFDNLTSYKK